MFRPEASSTLSFFPTVPPVPVPVGTIQGLRSNGREEDRRDDYRNRHYGRTGGTTLSSGSDSETEANRSAVRTRGSYATEGLASDSFSLSLTPEEESGSVSHLILNR